MTTVTRLPPDPAATTLYVARDLTAVLVPDPLPSGADPPLPKYQPLTLEVYLAIREQVAAAQTETVIATVDGGYPDVFAAAEAGVKVNRALARWRWIDAWARMRWTDAEIDAAEVAFTSINENKNKSRSQSTLKNHQPVG